MAMHGPCMGLAWTMHGISMDHAWDRMGPQYGYGADLGRSRLVYIMTS